MSRQKGGRGQIWTRFDPCFLGANTRRGIRRRSRDDLVPRTPWIYGGIIVRPPVERSHSVALFNSENFLVLWGAGNTDTSDTR